MSFTAPHPLVSHPLPGTARPRLRAVSVPPPRRRAPSAHAVAAYCLGALLGFLAVGAVSLPAGAGAVLGPVQLALVAAVVGGVAALRVRAGARRR